MPKVIFRNDTSYPLPRAFILFLICLEVLCFKSKTSPTGNSTYLQEYGRDAKFIHLKTTFSIRILLGNSRIILVMVFLSIQI